MAIPDYQTFMLPALRALASADTLTNFSLAWAGDSAYDVNPPRWGDYSGAGADPGDGSVWIAGEYSTSWLFGPLWGTAITQVTP